MEIDGRTKLVALFGHPVEHTLSPLIHNSAFQAQGLHYRYVAFNVHPDHLEAALHGASALGFLGANITIPHKEAILPFLDDVSPQAAAVGAVNTVVIRRSAGTTSLYGDNTDVTGFLTPLAPYVEEVRTKPILVFGSGGAARAIVYALANVLRPPALTIAARNTNAAERLVQDLMPTTGDVPSFRVLSLDQAGPAVRESGLVVNTTPLGMSPDADSSPWHGSEEFHEEQVVYDLVYNPIQTRLLQIAQSQGATCIDGLEMLIQQASASYRLFTGMQMPVDRVREVLTQNQE